MQHASAKMLSSWLATAVLAAVSGCGANGDAEGASKDGGDGKGGSDDPRASESLKIEIEADTSEIAKEKSELDAKRKEIEDEAAALEEVRTKLAASAGEAKGKKKGDDTAGELTALLDRERALRAKETSYLADLAKLDTRKDKVIAKAAGGLATAGAKASGGAGTEGAGGAGAGAGARTGGDGELAGREKKMADREADLARREKTLAEREAALAEREAKLAGGGISMITKIEVPAGTTYTRKNVDASYGRAKAVMKKKGLLPSDLPAGADALSDQIDSAITKGDFTTAKVLADTLGDTVEKIKVDRAFLSAKIARLNAYLRAKKITPDDGTIWPMFTQATKDFTDGRFGAANATINNIYATLK